MSGELAVVPEYAKAWAVKAAQAMGNPEGFSFSERGGVEISPEASDEDVQAITSAFVKTIQLTDQSQVLQFLAVGDMLAELVARFDWEVDEAIDQSGILDELDRSARTVQDYFWTALRIPVARRWPQLPYSVLRCNGAEFRKDPPRITDIRAYNQERLALLDEAAAADPKSEKRRRKWMRDQMKALYAKYGIPFAPAMNNKEIRRWAIKVLYLSTIANADYLRRWGLNKSEFSTTLEYAVNELVLMEDFDYDDSFPDHPGGRSIQKAKRDKEERLARKKAKEAELL